MPDFAVGTAFTSKDRGILRSFNKMALGANKFGRNSENAFNKASRAGSRFKDVTKGILAAGTVSRGLGLLQRGLGAVTRQYVEFDDEIFGATARFKSAEKSGTYMTQVMKNLRVAAREVGAETQFTATQAAFGLNKFALAGFNSAEAIKSLRSQVDLTTVTGEEFGRVADISSDLLGAFGGAALESTKKVAMLKKMNALLAVGTLSANVTMEDLFDTLKDAAPIGKLAGKSMQDIIATTSILGSAGIKGTAAATAMKNIFLRLSAPTKEVDKALAKLNLSQKSFVDNQGKLKPTLEIFKLLGDKAKKFSDVEVVGIFKALAGLRGTAGAAVLSKNIGQLREQLIRMGKDPQKVMKETAAFMRQSLGNRIKTLESGAVELGFKFLAAFDGDAKTGIQNLTEAIKKIDVKPFVASAQLIVKVFKVLIPLIPTIIKGFITYKAILLSIAVTQKAIIAIGWIKYLWLMRSSIWKATTALIFQNKTMIFSRVAMVASKIALIAWNAVVAVATSATWLFGAAVAFLTSPVGLIIIAVGALIAGIILLVKNWDIVKVALINGADTIADFFKTTFFTLADILLTTWGNIAKGIVSITAQIGKAVGFDVSGLEKTVNKINSLQKSVRSKSAFGNGSQENQESPNAEQAQSTQYGGFQADINFNNLPKDAEIKEKRRGAPFVNLNLLGANP